ncbi:MAG TPA: hypothetical protein VMF03_20895 [Steroidobacteraceae bacterium]|nr:hypothetical protein [Steroidobacteraceae bacterium]
METFRWFFPFFVIGGSFVLVACCMVIAVWSERASKKARDQAVQILMLYAQRGEAPPQTVIDGLAIVRSRPQSKPAKPETRGRHF